MDAAPRLQGTLWKRNAGFLRPWRSRCVVCVCLCPSCGYALASVGRRTDLCARPLWRQTGDGDGRRLPSVQQEEEHQQQVCHHAYVYRRVCVVMQWLSVLMLILSVVCGSSL